MLRDEWLARPGSPPRRAESATATARCCRIRSSCRASDAGARDDVAQHTTRFQVSAALSENAAWRYLGTSSDGFRVKKLAGTSLKPRCETGITGHSSGRGM